MTTQIVKRMDKGFPLTYSELDSNFENLRTTADIANDKITSISSIFSSLKTSISSLTSNQLIDSTTFSESSCAVKYVIKLSSDTKIHIEEILIAYDGTNTYISEYGVIISSTTLASFSEGFSNGKLNLYITPTVSPLNISLVKQIVS